MGLSLYPTIFKEKIMIQDYVNMLDKWNIKMCSHRIFSDVESLNFVLM